MQSCLIRSLNSTNPGARKSLGETKFPVWLAVWLTDDSAEVEINILNNELSKETSIPCDMCESIISDYYYKCKKHI